MTEQQLQELKDLIAYWRENTTYCSTGNYDYDSGVSDAELRCADALEQIIRDWKSNN